MSERGFPRIQLQKREAREANEAYTPEQLGKITLESFMMSQGSSATQLEILMWVLRKHPAMLPVIRAWKEKLIPKLPKKEDLPEWVWNSMHRSRYGIDSTPTTQRNWQFYAMQFDVEAFNRDPVVQELVRKAEKFVMAPWHPKPEVLYKQGPDGTKELMEGEELAQKVREITEEQIALRLAELFIAEHVTSLGEDGEIRKISESEARLQLVHSLIQRDEMRTLKALNDPDPRVREWRAKQGVSHIVSCALSKNREAAQARYPKELREIWEMVGGQIRRGVFGLSDGERATMKNLIRLYNKHNGPGEKVSVLGVS